jgi:23S rRNA (uracil1939-C5)-methyltransferase
MVKQDMERVPMSEVRQVEVTIVGIAQGGDGVARLPDGRVLFVPRAVPGDVVRVELVQSKKAFARGHVLEVLVRAAQRIESSCPYFDRGCGGCQYQHVDYDSEVHWKAQAAFEAMSRISKVALPEPKVFSSSQRQGYRNRATFHVAGGRLGFYGSASRRLIEVEQCSITNDAINAALSELGSALGRVRSAELLVELAGHDEVVATLDVDGGLDPETEQRLSRLVETSRRIRGVRAKSSRGNREWGRPLVDVSFALARPPVDEFSMPSGQFRQANAELNQRLVGYVRDLVARNGVRRVLELYAGAGNFSFALADLLEAFLGLEGNPVAIEAAQQMAARAGMAHMNFAVADLNDGIPASTGVNPGEFDAVILDPPRQGAAEVCRGLTRDGRPRHVIYVSCDPACLGRDLQILKDAGYEIRELSFFDMFPGTAHIETVVYLESM